MKLPLFNDPLYGFISFPSPLLFELVEHPFYQRLRRISQLGLTNMVYPGANHTRFQHALGAMHLMMSAIHVLRSKGVEITPKEEEAACAAILLHDIGHGPYSHALEHGLVRNVNHEHISSAMMERLNKIFDGQLEMAIDIFKGTYPKHFLHQLISSQVDVDRLDYLNRDSFFTGVAEGVVNVDRIISVMDVRDNRLVFFDKGLFSIEKFLMARRLMYWQVYVHKTVLSAEFLLVKILKRSYHLARRGVDLPASATLRLFLYNDYPEEAFNTNDEILSAFADLDDFDVMSAVKGWSSHSDPILAQLCTNMINRHLFKVEMSDVPMSDTEFEKLVQAGMKRYGFSREDMDYIVFRDSITIHNYDADAQRIEILEENEVVKGFDQVSDIYRYADVAAPATKHFVAYPKSVESA